MGGPRKEWFLVLSKEIFNPHRPLFEISQTGKTYIPHNQIHLESYSVDIFKFIGKFIGKALYDGEFIEASFARSFYKHITGTAIIFKD